jgi:hypothetical protein
MFQRKLAAKELLVVSHLDFVAMDTIERCSYLVTLVTIPYDDRYHAIDGWELTSINSNIDTRFEISSRWTFPYSTVELFSRAHLSSSRQSRCRISLPRPRAFACFPLKDLVQRGQTAAIFVYTLSSSFSFA